MGSINYRLCLLGTRALLINFKHGGDPRYSNVIWRDLGALGFFHGQRHDAVGFDSRELVSRLDFSQLLASIMVVSNDNEWRETEGKWLRVRQLCDLALPSLTPQELSVLLRVCSDLPVYLTGDLRHSICKLILRHSDSSVEERALAVVMGFESIHTVA